MARGPSDTGLLGFLYGTAPGRLLLRPLTARWLSRLAGRFMDSRLSRPLIAPFIRKNGIEMGDYLPEQYPSFNAFFTRKIRPEARPLDRDPAHLMAPCDGRLSVYAIDKNSVFTIKHSRYDVAALLGGDDCAEQYQGGMALVFRLCVDDYHRYHYLDDGVKEDNHFIPGVLHTVRPIALEHTDVFIQNCREYSILHTDHFGAVAQIEVGALLVGRISNNLGAGSFRRGEEKGKFLYGGSTIVLLLPPGAAEIEDRYWQATARGEEVRVRLGQCVGHARKE